MALSPSNIDVSQSPWCRPQILPTGCPVPRYSGRLAALLDHRNAHERLLSGCRLGCDIYISWPILWFRNARAPCATSKTIHSASKRIIIHIKSKQLAIVARDYFEHSSIDGRKLIPLPPRLRRGRVFRFRFVSHGTPSQPKSYVARCVILSISQR